jgi:ribose/xylose/arabinose/galactoside ABC-type transport system permease subunit
MAYEDSRFSGEPGFRDEPDFRTTTGSTGTADLRGASRRRPSAGELLDVFDDPEHGEPGRDRMAVHFVWEALLLIAVGGVGFLLAKADKDALHGAALKDLLVFTAAVGFLALAAGVSLRAGVPNLAIGPVAMAGAVFFAGHSGKGTWPTTGVVVLLTAAVGLAIGALVAAFHVPAWAASFGLSLAAVAWVHKHDAPISVQSKYDPTAHGWLWFGGFVVIALFAAAVGMSKPVRRSVGRFRPVSDPAHRRGVAAAALAAGALVLSCGLAGFAGVLMAMRTDKVGLEDGGFTASGLTLTGLGLGAALLGGTSAYGRRGGLFGTILGTVLLTLFIGYAQAEDWKIATLVVGGGAIGIGLLITRLVEAFGRPHSDDEYAGPSYVPRQSNGYDSSWSNATTSTNGRAEDEAWGTSSWASH